MMMVGIIVTVVTLFRLARTCWGIRKQGWRQQIQNMRVSKIKTCGPPAYPVLDAPDDVVHLYQDLSRLPVNRVVSEPRAIIYQ